MKIILLLSLFGKKKQGGGNDSTNFVIEHEYILCYAKILSNIKLGLDSKHELDDALYPFKDENNTEYGLVTLDKSSIRFSESLVFEIKDKDGSSYFPRIVKGKQSCWRWGKKKVEEEYNDLVFKNGKVYTKYYRPSGIVPKSILYETRFGRTESGKDAIKDVLGNAIFSYPKPIELIEHFIRLSLLKNEIILDFFAGSGTTLQSTMRINAEDGGKRQCILVTNNENNICEDVTYERNKRVISGYKNAKDVSIDGLRNNNLRYYKTDFVPSYKSEENKRKITIASTDQLCIKEDCYTDVTEINGMDPKLCRIYTNGRHKYTIIVYHSRQQMQVCEQLTEYIKTLHTLSEKVRLYAFSPEKETLTDEFREVADKIEALPLPEAIYNAYRATFRAIRLDKKPPLPITTEPDSPESEPDLFTTTNEA